MCHVSWWHLIWLTSSFDLEKMNISLFCNKSDFNIYYCQTYNVHTAWLMWLLLPLSWLPLLFLVLLMFLLALSHPFCWLLRMDWYLYRQRLLIPNCLCSISSYCSGQQPWQPNIYKIAQSSLYSWTMYIIIRELRCCHLMLNSPATRWHQVFHFLLINEAMQGKQWDKDVGLLGLLSKAIVPTV